MREIKFRGIPINKDDEHSDTVLNSIAFYEGSKAYDDTFIYGHLNGEYILGKTIETTDEYYRPSYWIEVDTKTIGQYTGLKDRNGTEVYEGDIVKVVDDEGEYSILNSDTGIGKVEWLEEWGFWNVSKIENSLSDLSECYYIEVIGNIYENPKLLEVE